MYALANVWYANNFALQSGESEKINLYSKH